MAPAPRPSGWIHASPLAGYSIHAGLDDGTGILLAGEQSGGRGVLLRFTAALAGVASIPEARTLRALASHEGTIYLGGQDQNGSGLVMAGPPFTRVPLPSDVTEVDALAVRGGTITASGEAGTGAVVIQSVDGGRSWRRRIFVGARRGFARLPALGGGSEILSGGTDGVGAVLVVGRKVRRLHSLTSVLGVASGSSVLIASGYSGLLDSTRGGVVLRSTDEGATWRQTPIPNAVSAGAVCLRGPYGALVVSTGTADEILETADAGATWHRAALASPADPLTLEGLVATARATWAFGPSGLFRRESA